MKTALTKLMGTCPFCGAGVQERVYEINRVSSQIFMDATSLIRSTCTNGDTWTTWEDHELGELPPTYAADLEANGITVDVVGGPSDPCAHTSDPGANRL